MNNPAMLPATECEVSNAYSWKRQVSSYPPFRHLQLRVRQKIGSHSVYFFEELGIPGAVTSVIRRMDKPEKH